MKKIRFYLALWTAKAIRTLMRLLGRNATYLPGMMAVKICPDFMGQLMLPKTVIAVTGTNGKTTVSNLLTSILTKNGYSVTNNSLGSNVQGAIATTLLADSDLLGRAKKDIAVLEVDERSSLLVYPYVKPDYLMCNNIMQDSIKRNAHTDFIRFIINKGLPASTKLILNGDDPICASLGSTDADCTYFGISAEKPQVSGAPTSDIVYCPRCGAKLETQYLRYDHIGKTTCPACGLGKADPDFLVTSIDRQNNTFTVTHDGKAEEFTLLNGNIVNIYNICAAIAVLTRLGLSYEQISEGLFKNSIVKSRYDQLYAGDLRITMQMAKGLNPIACTQGFQYVASCEGEKKGLIILIDDKRENIGDSENVCWQYDCDYSPLADASISQIVFAGPRCKDHYLRALLAGVPEEKIRQTSVTTDGAEVIDLSLSKDLYVLYDNYALEDAEAIRNKLMQYGMEGR